MPPNTPALLLDQNLPPSLTRRLGEAGIAATHVSARGLRPQPTSSLSTTRATETRSETYHR